jgi:pimeloyl-ACP methyl ester carboxylesterase
MTSCVLLIHGAYQGDWIWERTTSALRTRRAEVLAPSLDGCAERAHQLRPGISTESHADELAELLRLHDWQEVTLVGTSTGGMVACALAERVRERVSRIVLADALALFDGESLPDIVTRRNSVDTPLGSAPSVEDARDRLFAELDDETRDWALERYSLQPINVMTAPVSLPSFWQQDWDADVVWCRNSQNPPRAHLARAADKLDASWHELDTGHYPMLQAPQELADIILG